MNTIRYTCHVEILEYIKSEMYTLFYSYSDGRFCITYKPLGLVDIEGARSGFNQHYTTRLTPSLCEQQLIDK